MAIPSKNIRAERIKGTLDASEFDVSGDLIINGDLTITGTTSISTITPRSTAASIFLTTESNEVRSRTAAQVLTDIGAQAALTNPVTGTGTSGQVSFWTGTNSQSGDAGLIWDNVNKRFGIGASPASTVLLDVRAQGTLSTDIAFRVRNSADTRDFLVVNGAGDVFNRGAGGVSSNTFFGENVGRNASGGFNTLIGFNAGRDLTSGAQNMLFGWNAGRSITTGNQNCLFGFEVGLNITNTSSNSLFGRAAGRSITGNQNTLIGNNSGFNIVTGSDNCFLGNSVGFFIGNGSNCTSITNSILIGSGVRPLADNQTNQIVIGHNAIGLGSNTTVIGNSSTTLFRPYGNVAIGADTAGATLDVRAQGVLSTDIAFRVRNSADNANLISVAGNGNTTLTPSDNTTALTVSGYNLTGANAQSALSITGTWNTTGAPSALLVNITNTASNANSLLMDLQVGGDSLFRFGRNGILSFNTSSVLSIYGQNNGSPITTVNAGFAFRSSLLNTAVGPDFVFINGQGARDITSGSGVYFSIQPQPFSPTSGTATFTTLQVTQRINQTGGANGITRGLFVNPTLTAAADWRSIEWTNNTGRGLWGTGTADNAMAGSLSVGIAETPQARLDVRAQGALSTDIAFRVRNKADSANLIEVNGIGQTTLTPSNNTTALTVSGYNLTGSNAQPAVDISGTWNTSGTPTLIRANVIDTASNPISLLMDLQVGGVSQFRISKVGAVTTVGNIQSFTINTTGGFNNARSVISVTNSSTTTTGIVNGINNSVSFQPPSGTSTFSSLLLNNIINQTGGANGITRGLFINPTLTAAADWRSIEWSNNTGRGLWGTGTADNAMAGSLSVGIAATPQARLDVRAQGALSTDTVFRVRNSTDSDNIISVQGNGVLQHTSLPSTTVSTTTNVYSFPTTLGRTFKMMYTVESGSDIRGGEYICVHDGTNINTIHTFPTEFGDTSGINFTFSISGGNIVVTANVTTGTWAVKLNIQIL